MFNDLQQILNNLTISYRSNYVENISDEESVMRQLTSYLNKQNFDWVKRLQDTNRKSIPDWSDPKSYSTHKLSYADDGYFDYIYPEVQMINGKLIDFTDPKNKHLGRGIDSAFKSGEVFKVPKGFGEIFTKLYKNYYSF